MFFLLASAALTSWPMNGHQSLRAQRTRLSCNQNPLRDPRVFQVCVCVCGCACVCCVCVRVWTVVEGLRPWLVSFPARERLTATPKDSLDRSFIPSTPSPRIFPIPSHRRPSRRNKGAAGRRWCRETWRTTSMSTSSARTTCNDRDLPGAAANSVILSPLTSPSGGLFHPRKS